MRLAGFFGLALLAGISTASGQEPGAWTSGPYEGMFRAVNKADTGEASFVCKDGRFSANYSVSLQQLPPALEGTTTAGVGLEVDGSGTPRTIKSLEFVGYAFGAVSFGGQRAQDWANDVAGAKEKIDFFLLDEAGERSNLSSYSTAGAAEAIAAVLTECKLK